MDRLICKNLADEPKLESLDFRLKFILELLSDWASKYCCPQLVITDVDTPGIHMANGPHYRKQAVDVRIQPLGLDRCLEFAKYVNSVLDYGRGFNVAIVGSIDPTGRHNDHMHIQVPPPYYAAGKIKLTEVS